MNYAPGKGLASLEEELTKKGHISADDVLRLRRQIFPDGVVDAAEAEAVFRLDHACATKDGEWTRFYVDALTDFFVWQSKPRGYVSEDQARLLIDQVSRDGRIDSMSELELLINVVHWAQSCPHSVALLALNAVRESVLTPETASYGSNRPPAVISPADVEIIRRLIYAPGSPGGFTVTQQEAELMFELNNATTEAENAPGWGDLFVKAIANFLMFPRGAPIVPTAEETLRREAWLKERRGVGDLLSRIARHTATGKADWRGAWEEVDPFGKVAKRKEQEQEDARVREALSRETIDEAEAGWLMARIGADGMVHENERALLAFIKQNSPSIHPSLDNLFAKAGV